MVYGPYQAILTDWHDGDTCHLNIDLGFSNYLYGHDLLGNPTLSCRIWGINAPELSTAAGKVSRDWAIEVAPPGTMVSVLSHGWDKYGGRFDGEIILPNGDNFATLAVAAGMAVPLN